MLWFMPITRSPAQKPAHKDLGRNGQARAITPKAAYAPVSNRAGSRSLSITRSPAQKSACKDLKRNGKARPSRLRPLTLRFLTAPARAHFLERSNVWMVVKIKEGYMPFHEYKTYYRIVGEPSADKAPLLIHGGPGSSHNYFELMDDYAETGRQLIMYDQVGCGKSSLPEDPGVYVKETWAEELVALRKFLHLDELHMLGQSWGGMLEMYYLTSFDPQGIKSVMIDGSPASIKLWVQEQHRLIKYLSYEDRAAIAEAERTGDFTNVKYLAANDRYMEKYCWDDPDENSPEPLRRPTNGKRASLIAEGPNEFTENGTISDFDVTDQLHKIHVPVLVTSGTDDLCTPLIAKSVVDHIPGAKWHLFANSRHLALLDQHDEFIHVLDQWLAAND